MKNTFKIIVPMTIIAFTLAGCYYSGTYTYRGNTANIIYEDERVGTATLSGSTLTGTFQGETFTVTKSNTGSNPFVGLWVGSWGGGRVEAVVSNNFFGVSFDDDLGYGFYSRNGNTVTVISDGERIGTASVSGNNMTGTILGNSFTVTKLSANSSPFAGVWTGTFDGDKIESVISDTNWVLYWPENFE